MSSVHFTTVDFASQITKMFEIIISADWCNKVEFIFVLLRFVVFNVDF